MPMLLSVLVGYQALNTVTDQWTKEWKHIPNPPQIRFMWYIFQNRALHNALEAKLPAMEASYNFKAEAMFPANGRRQRHMTKRERNLGDPVTNQRGSANPQHVACASSGDCRLTRESMARARCLKRPFIFPGHLPILMDTYVKQIAPSRYRPC